MREKKRVAVLFGGCSDEYEVSLKSTYSIITNMDQEKYELILVGITKEGKWLRYVGKPEGILKDDWAQDQRCVSAFFSPSREVQGLLEFHEEGCITVPVDVIFPVLHGRNGEDGTVQGLLALTGIPYVGCGVLASATGMDKSIAHQLAADAGVKVTRSSVFRRGDDMDAISQAVWQYQYPLYVKPANGGSSIGITKVEDPAKLICAVKKAFECDRKIVVEESIPGFEVGCAVIGGEELILGMVDELQLHGITFDYEEKYHMTKTIHHVPARIEEKVAEEIQQAAIAVYRSMECKGLARVDFFLTPDGDVVFNEINTMPGFTTGSRYPKMLMAAGMEFGEILDLLIENAVKEIKAPEIVKKWDKQGVVEKMVDAV